MKMQKNKKQGRKFWIIALIAGVLAILAILVIGGIIVLWAFSDSERIIRDVNPNTIKVYADENFSDANNLKKIYLANIYVINGGMYKEIINNSRKLEITLLTNALEEIKGKETLPLTVEPELGLLQAAEISKNDSLFIYAVAEHLRSYFDTETAYTSYIKRSILSGANCSEEYDKIDSDLKNANYCENDSDCKTLPLGSVYIEFGCYHYINKKENSTLFYSRMNEYYAECGQIIDLCRISPEPKCAEGKCIEASE